MNVPRGTSNESFSHLMAQGEDFLGRPVTQEEMAQFSKYLQEVLRWNRRINLTGARTIPELINRHLIDSLAVFLCLPRGDNQRESSRRILDFGSGAGFPSIPLKVCQPNLTLTMVESRKKKAAFLLHICSMLDINGANIISERLEDRSIKGHSIMDIGANSYHTVLVRGIFLRSVLPVLKRLIHPQGQVIYWASAHYTDPDIPGWSQIRTVHYRLPHEESERHLVMLSSRN